MTDLTPRFGLPLLVAGQAQKEEAHNEAVVALEALVQPVAQALGDSVPPPAPQPGQSWIVGAAPAGDWAGRADALATWTAGGWRFAAAADGMAVYVLNRGLVARFVGGGWSAGAIAAASVAIGGVQVVGPRQAAVAAPAGGAVIDAEARAAVAAILAALRAHGLVAA